MAGTGVVSVSGGACLRADNELAYAEHVVADA